MDYSVYCEIYVSFPDFVEHLVDQEILPEAVLVQEPTIEVRFDQGTPHVVIRYQES